MTDTVTLVGLAALVVTTLAGMWKQNLDHKNAMDLIKLQHEIDVADREQKAKDAERTAKEVERNLTRDAEAVRNRLDVSALEVKQSLSDSAGRLRDRVDVVRDRLDTTASTVKADNASALDAQTSALMIAIEEAKRFMAEAAEKTYHEANGQNAKLAKLHMVHERQGKVLKALLDVIQQSAATETPQRRATDRIVAAAREAIAVPVP